MSATIVVAHGTGSVSFVEHADKPFRVSGILAKTGTPLDRTLHVSLEAIEAIHVDWQNGIPMPGQSVSADEVRQMHLEPKAITAALVGLKSKLATFKLQRAINEYSQEPLSAIIPGAALQELWGLVGTAETALSVVSAMVVATALLGMVTMILTTLNERRREMAILRSVGARPATILGLLATEAGLLTLAGVVLGVVLLYAALGLLQPWIDGSYGLHLDIDPPTRREWLTLLTIVVAGFLAGLLPAMRAYRLSLADGMTVLPEEENMASFRAPRWRCHRGVAVTVRRAADPPMALKWAKLRRRANRRRWAERSSARRRSDGGPPPPPLPEAASCRSTPAARRRYPTAGRPARSTAKRVRIGSYVVRSTSNRRP
jgi:hypothetical protein